MGRHAMRSTRHASDSETPCRRDARNAVRTRAIGPRYARYKHASESLQARASVQEARQVVCYGPIATYTHVMATRYRSVPGPEAPAPDLQINKYFKSDLGLRHSTL